MNSHGRLCLHLVGRAPVPRRQLRLAELYGRRRRLPVRRAARSGLLLGLAALDEQADGHEEDNEDDDGEDHGPRDACVEIKFQAPDAVDALSS